MKADLRKSLKYFFLALYPYFYSFREGYRAFRTKHLSAVDLVEVLEVDKLTDKEIKQILIQYDRSKGNIFFVQIGSNDGKTGDPIYEIVSQSIKWKGILVEPIPYLYQKLLENYKVREDLIFEQALISNDSKEVIFYSINPNCELDLPWYWNQISSIKKEHILKHFGEKIVPYIREEKFNAFSYKTLLSKHKYKRVDFLHVDAEGHDYEIIKQINFDFYAPEIILVEFRHLSYFDCLKLFKKLKSKYQIYCNGSDFFCLNKGKCSSLISKLTYL